MAKGVRPDYLRLRCLLLFNIVLCNKLWRLTATDNGSAVLLP